MASTKRTADTISGLLRIRASKFTGSTAFVMLCVFALAQSYIVNVSFNKSRSATESWISANKQRIEQALFLENTLAINGLLEESNGLKLDHQQILGVKVVDSKGKLVTEIGDANDGPRSALAEVLMGHLTTDVALEFADRPQGILTVCTSIDRSQLVLSALIALLITVIAVALINLLAQYMIRDIRARALDPLSALTTSIAAHKSSSKDLIPLEDTRGATIEVRALVSSYNKLIEQVRVLNDRERAQADLKGKIEIAAQVSHDIRSPLSALRMVLAVTKNLEPQERSLVQSSIDRINSIAETLLQKSRLASAELAAGSFDVVRAINEMMREKRVEFPSHDLVIECACDSLEVRGNFDQFKTVISNLLNNAIESREDGLVTIRIHARETSALIEIEDNGCGIPSNVLALLGQSPVTFGKEKGNGIGVFSSSKTIESFGGRLTFSSSVGLGSRASVELRLKLDEILLREIDLDSRTHIVVVDDDHTIASMWRMTLPQKVALTTINSPEEFSQKFEAFEEHALFLIDHRFENSTTTGLDLIRRLQLQERAILVTSDAYDPKLRESVRQSRIRIMSKDDICNQVRA